MKRYRDPDAAIERPEPELPLIERILCGIIVTILIVGVVWMSVWMDRRWR